MKARFNLLAIWVPLCTAGLPAQVFEGRITAVLTRSGEAQSWTTDRLLPFSLGLPNPPQRLAAALLALSALLIRASNAGDRLLTKRISQAKPIINKP